jgi:hypothetical protein
MLRQKNERHCRFANIHFFSDEEKSSGFFDSEAENK